MLQVSSDKDKLNIKSRNIVSTVTMQLDIINVHNKIPKKPQDMVDTLMKLHAGNTEGKEEFHVINNSEEDPLISPEHLIATLPCSLYNRVNEKLIGWEAYPVTTELQNMINTLDSVSVHNTHKIGLIYIPPACIYIIHLYHIRSTKRKSAILHKNFVSSLLPVFI